MSNIVPQPQITFENNKIYVDSPVDVKYTLDGLDPVFYGVIYTSPISISHTTTIKAISVNSLGEYSNLVAGTFTPESDVSDGSSGSTWNPSYDDAVTLEELSAMSYVTSYALESASYATTTYVADYVAEHGGGEMPDLSSYITSDELAQELSSYVTKDELSDCGYITIEDIPETDLSDYVTYDFLSSQSYLTSIPSEYITQQELSSNSYLTQHQSLNSYLFIPASINTNSYSGQFSIFPNGIQINQYGQVHAGFYNYNQIKSQNYHWMSSGSTRNMIHGILADSAYLTSVPSEYITQTELSANSYLTEHQSLVDYVTKTDLSNQSYATTSQIPVIDESIIPNTTNTYTLGNSTHYYDATYTTRLCIPSTGGNIRLGENGRYFIGDGAIRPTDSNRNLGTSQYSWAYTYTQNLILNGEDINDKFISTEGGTITGRLESTYYTTLNYLGGISSYSSILVGADDRNSVTMLATRRLCGETSYAAAFFTNSDGRSKFTHKTKTTATTALGSNDDAFLCFNAYGFKLAYSGIPGTSATTEYEILHTGNIGNLGYATTTELSSYLSLSGGNMTGNIDFGTSRAYITAKSDGQWKNAWGYAPLKVMSYASTNGSAWTPVFAVRDWGGNVWSAGVVNTREFIFSYQAVGNVGSSNSHVEWKINSSGDLTGAGRTFIHSSNYNNYNTTYTYSLADKITNLETSYVSKAMFSFDSSTNTLTITTT